ncbi:Zinc finger CCCH domain-containing protein 48 [Linum perenne]
MDLDANGGNRGVFHRLSGGSGGGARPRSSDSSKQNQKVCYHWRAGKCNRYPCPFLHRELSPPNPATNGGGGKRGFGNDSGFSGPPATRRAPNFNNSSTWGRPGNSSVVKKAEKVCNYWVQGKCTYGENCRFLHGWSLGESFGLLTQLEGHQNIVSGIALPSGSDKLYTGSKDETVRVWDCQSGQFDSQCMGVINVGGEVGCMITEGPWLFVGLPNLVKAWNLQTNADLSLNGPVGQVYAMVVGNDLLFAGTQDSAILAWKYNVGSSIFEPAASLKGHSLAVVSLIVGANRLFSGSMDNSIKVWNLETLQCIQTLTGHTAVVMSLLCWDQFLLSSSLDQTIKVWAATESGNLEVTYTQKEDHGLLTLCGMHDLEGKPILLCSSNDNTVRIYDLPSFSERSKIFSKQEIRAIQAGPAGLFFTGDGTGQVRVWNCKAEQQNPAAAT